MHGPGLTTRQWMAIVLAAGLLAGTYVHARRWYWRAELAAASQAEQVARDWYDEGRVTVDRYLEASERLMNAQLALSPTVSGQKAVGRKHLAQVKRILELEENDLSPGRGGNVADIAELKQHIEVVQLRLGLPSAP